MIKIKALKLRPIHMIILTIALALALFISGPKLLDMLISRYSPQGMIYRALPMIAGRGPSDDTTVVAATAQHDQSDIETEPEIQFELLELEEGVSEEVRIELLQTKSESVNLRGEEPKILIYSTHSTEAYTPTEAMPYVKTTDWRTADQSKNVMAVGAALAKQLNEKYGLSVIHVTKDHEPPQGTSYDRSVETMEEYLEKYPSIDLFIDVHRDSLKLKEGEVNTDFVMMDGEKTARVMFVVGTGEGRTGAGFNPKPNYKQTYAISLAINEKLIAINPKLVRKIRINPGRYNQHVAGRCILIEVGHNQNTLEEALNAVPYLAQAISEVAGN